MVQDAFRVMPHPVSVDNPAARAFGHAEHRAVDVVRYTGNHVGRGGAPTRGPVAPDQLVIAADATRGDDHRLSTDCEVADDLSRTSRAPADVARGQGLPCDTGH